MDQRPKDHEHINAIVEARLKDLEAESLAATVTIEWRGGNRTLPVIPMPTELLYYNPHTRRIRAQRDVDPIGAAALNNDPFSDAAQAYLENLLMWNPADPGSVDNDFLKLKADLELGQNEPGLITRDGVLINGNTRCAALRALGREHIIVGVLPADAGRADIDAIELALQLRRSYKRDYSFVNELIAIREHVDKGESEAKILKAFRMKKPRLDRSLWLLAFIDDAIERSKTTDASGATVSLRRFDFERDQGQLEELHTKWSGLNKEDPNAAELMREARLAGIVLDFAKTDLRAVGPDFIEKYFAPKRGHKNLPLPETGDAEAVPGLPGVVLQGDPPELKQARAITTQLLKARALSTAADPGNPLPEETAQLLVDSRSAYDEAKKLAGADDSLKKKSLTPSDRLLEASDRVDYATMALSESIAVSAVDVASLDGGLESIQESLIRLARVVSRFENHQDASAGVAWLIASANLTVEADSDTGSVTPDDVIIVD